LLFAKINKLTKSTEEMHSILLGENIGVKKSESYIQLGNNHYCFDIISLHSKLELFNNSS